MTDTVTMRVTDVDRAGADVAEALRKKYGRTQSYCLIGIPRGGVVAAMNISRWLQMLKNRVWVRACGEAMPDDLNEWDPVVLVIVDDLAVTGKTLYRERFIFQEMMGLEIAEAVVLVRKGDAPIDVGATPLISGRDVEGEWVTFPWEASEGIGPEDAVRRLIEYVGDDPTRAGVRDTPARVLRYYDELREGAEAVRLETFVGQYEDLVIVKGIAFASLCEHHMLPYLGDAHVGYIPDGKVLGLSKVARLVTQEASGLTLQEDLSRSIAAAVSEAVGTPHVAVVTKAAHTCMMIRGPKARESETIANAMLGSFRKDAALRSEFMQALLL